MMYTKALVGLLATIQAGSVVGDNFHMKVKVEPNPPRVNELSALALSLYNFQRMEVMDWEEILEGADQDDYKDALVSTWIVGSDFNEVGYYEFPRDHPFDPMQNKFNMPQVFLGNGRYMVAGRLKLPAGKHPAEELEQAVVIKTTTGGYDYTKAYDIVKFDTKFRSPFSMVHYSARNYFDRIADPKLRKKLFLQKKIGPISKNLYDDEVENERHDIWQDHDGVTFTVHSHASEDPEPYVDDEGRVVEPEAGEDDDMFMLKTTFVKEVLYEDAVNATVTEALLKESHANEVSAYRAKVKTCRSRKERAMDQDLSTCGVLQYQLSRCQVCMPGEGDEEVCAIDTSCSSVAKVKFVDFLMTMGSTMNEGGGNWILRFRTNTTQGGDDHVADSLAVPTVVETFPNGTEHLRIHGSNNTVCPGEGEEPKFVAYDNGTITLVHKYDIDGFYNAVVRYVIEDGSVVYSTGGFMIPEIPRIMSLPICEDELDELEEMVREQEQGSFDDLAAPEPGTDGITELVKNMGIGFVVVFIVSFGFLLIVKPGSSPAPKAKTE